MLTNQDLKNIGNLIESKLEEKLESKLEEKLESKLEEKLDSKLDEKLDSKLAPIKKDINGIKKDIKKINKNMERDFSFHETQNRYVIKNVQQIQKHLDIPVMSIEAPNNF